MPSRYGPLTLLGGQEGPRMSGCLTTKYHVDASGKVEVEFLTDNLVPLEARRPYPRPPPQAQLGLGSVLALPGPAGPRAFKSEGRAKPVDRDAGPGQLGPAGPGLMPRLAWARPV
eukprot:tig00000404_g408.t1